MSKKHVVIVGGGFGGIKTALELAASKNFRVTLISDQPNFRYYPALYHTATGGSRVVSSIPLDEILAGKGITAIIDAVTKLDRSHKKLTMTSGQEYGFDLLVLALGVMTNYFGIKGLPEYSFGIKTLDEAEELKAHLHQQLTDDRKPDLHYIVIGGGPTGVELAGALPKYLHEIMCRHGITDRKIHVDLIEAAPRLMPRMPEPVSRAIAKHLKKIGVKLYLGKTVQAETTDALMVNGKPIRSHTVIWTAGITNNPFFKENGFMLSQNGKVQVDNLLQAWPGIFVIGDNADTPYSGMAQTAMYDAVFVAHNLIRHADGNRPVAYKARKPIYVTPTGPGWATMVWGKIHLYGKLGWLMRRAADWVGYHDYEPWWKATVRTMADNNSEDNCAACACAEVK